MFCKFLSFFGLDNISIIDGNPFDMFMENFAGKQFGKGVFNVFLKEDIQIWGNIVNRAFSEVDGQFQVFGYDWLGDCFAISVSGIHKGHVLLFEIGTGEVLVIESNFLDFLNIELPQNYNACLAYNFYQDWLRNGGEVVSYGQCIGYKIPLFLGGKDEISNLEKSNMDVYWTVLTQFKSQIK